jgi:hypothetical protein
MRAPLSILPRVECSAGAPNESEAVTSRSFDVFLSDYWAAQASCVTRMGQPSPQPFRMHVADETLRVLRERLMRVRWPDEPPGAPWSTGSSVDYVRELVGYWRDGFDWRAQETALNRFQQFKVPVGGIDLHFIHEEGKGPNRRACSSGCQ